MSKKQKIAFISSTVLDLPEHRKAVMAACLQQSVFPKMMEHGSAVSDDAVGVSMAMVDIADIYIGIIAFRYGYVPGGSSISITEMEYNRAVERKIPRLVFLMDEEHPLKKSDVETGTGAERLNTLRKKMEKDQVVSYFTSPADLNAKVVTSLSQTQQKSNENILLYDTAIIEMLHPSGTRFGSLMAQTDPFPGFPYFSPDSDHPSQWPPRIFKDRTSFHNLIVQKLSGQSAAELAAWRTLSPPKISKPGTPATDPMLNYSCLRLFLLENDGDLQAVGNTIGPATESALSELEEARRNLEEDIPNRLMILRVLNQGDEDINNFITEFSLNGAVYDVTVNAMGKKAKSEEWTPNRFSVEIPILQPGYKVDVYIWYYYLPLDHMVFPGAMDFKWALTQGIVLENLAASGIRITHSDELLNDLVAYKRYQVDPVRNSPGFGVVGMQEEPEEVKQEENNKAGMTKNITSPAI